MKSLFRIGMLLAAAATTFASCSKDSAEGLDPESAQIKLTLTAGNPEVAPDAQGKGTRTEIEGTTPYWSVGDAIGVSIDGKANHSRFTNDATVRAQTTTFSGTVTAGSTLYTYYPCTNNGFGGTGDKAGVRVDLPANQTPTATSFDGKADLLIGNPLALSADGTAVGNLQFKRMSAIVKVVLKDNSTAKSLTGQHVASLSLDAGGKNHLAGRVTLNLITGKIFEPDYSQTSKVTATYSSATQYAIDGTSGSYLGVYARTLTAGSTLTIEASTEGFAITRTITLAQDVELLPGKINTLNITISDADLTPVAAGLALPFTDDFSWITSSSSTTISLDKYPKAEDGSALYSATDYTYPDTPVLKLGSSGNRGYFTTTELNLSQPFSVLVKAKDYGTDGSGLKVTAGEASQTATLTNEYADYLFTFDAQGSKATVRVDVTGKRGYISDFKIVSGHDVSILTVTSSKEVSAPAIGDAFTITYSVSNPTSGAVISADAATATWINSFDTSVSGEVSYLVDANTTGAARTGEITLTFPGTIGSAKVKVTQLADKFSADPASVVLGGDANATAEFTLTSDYTVGDPVVSDPAKFSVSAPVNNVYTVTALADGGDAEAELGTITFTRTVDNKPLVIPVSQAAKGGSGGPKYYVKVTTAPDDWSGTYIIAAGTSAANGTVTSNWLKYTTVSIVNDQIESSVVTDALAAVIEKNADGYYTIKFASIYLNSSGDKKLDTATTSTANTAQWSFSISGGNVSIATRATPLSLLRLNGTSGYRPYASSTGTLPSLYKLEN